MAKIYKIILALTLLFNVLALPVTAAGLLPDQQGGRGGDAACPKDAQGNPVNCGNYSLNDAARVAVKVSSLILSVVGSLALLAFVAGGLMLMLSAGNTDWVTRGKQTLIGAVIGLAIVFLSYAIIQLVFTSLGLGAVKWSVSDWFK